MFKPNRPTSSAPDAMTFTSTDWFNLPIEVDPDDEDLWERGTELRVKTSGGEQLLLSLRNNADDPVPALSVPSEYLLPSEMRALAQALEHLACVVDEISVSVYGPFSTRDAEAAPRTVKTQLDVRVPTEALNFLDLAEITATAQAAALEHRRLILHDRDHLTVRVPGLNALGSTAKIHLAEAAQAAAETAFDSLQGGAFNA